VIGLAIRSGEVVIASAIAKPAKRGRWERRERFIGFKALQEEGLRLDAPNKRSRPCAGAARPT
jgi:hypothetical protein